MSKTEQPIQDVDENDQPTDHSGKGGSYVIEDGKRRLVERTKSPEEAQAETAKTSGESV